MVGTRLAKKRVLSWVLFTLSGLVALTAAAPSAFADLCVSSVLTAQVLRYNETTGAFLGVCAQGGGLNFPIGVAFGPDGHLYVASNQNHSVLRYDGTTGAFLDTFVPFGSGGLVFPRGLVFGPDGNLYVSSFNDRVLRYDGATGAFIDAFVPPGSGGLLAPEGLVFGPDGHLYVSSFTNHRVLRYNGATGAFIDTFVAPGSGGLSGPAGLVFGPDGNLYVASFFNDRVLRYNGTTGAFIDVFASGNDLAVPRGLVFGPDGHLYVSSQLGDSVLRFDGTTGAFIDAFVSPGSGGLSQPTYLIFTPAAQRVVAIDIKPGSFPNSINPRSHGLIPVAILSSPSFDAVTQVNTASLRFGRTGTEPSLAFCNASPEDVNADGLLDQVCHFFTDRTGFQAGDTQGVLTGQTVGGVQFVGTDSVRIVRP